MTRLVTPDQLVALLEPAVQRGLVAFDVDGVLAPIVDHADDSRLLPGAAPALERLSAGASVMILSGRALESLERLFHFAPAIHVVGSHGLEIRGQDPFALDGAEQRRFDQLEVLGNEAIRAAGPGAWLEAKPASVVVHTREADPARAEPAVASLVELASAVDGAQLKFGHSVVELLSRRASKGDALLGHARLLGRAPIAYFGDDLTDEDAFVQMADDDVSVRVGDGATAARFRLADTAAVADVLDLLG